MDLVAKPAPAHAPTSKPRAANDLHARTKTSAVIDLRPAAKPTAAATAAPPIAKASIIKRISRAHLSVSGAAPAPNHPTEQSTDRYERARHINRSAQISRFGKTNSATTSPNPTPSSRPAAPAVAAPPTSELPQLAATQHAAMARLAASAPPPPTAPSNKTAAAKPKRRSKFDPSPNTRRAAAVAAAVVIMGAYIWFHNAPKLAIQNAGARAGITASLPSYLPSSYSLSHTNIKAGIVSLSFTSPSATAPLTITQASSSWDPNSLLDNYVAKATDDYDAVGGQGLTIYVFGKNTATWVNHGIWYSIAGASQLSRDQVLKIAYSL